MRNLKYVAIIVYSILLSNCTSSIFLNSSQLSDGLNERKTEMVCILDSLKFNDFDLKEHFDGLLNYEDTFYSFNPVPAYRVPMNILQSYKSGTKLNINRFLTPEKIYIACILVPENKNFHHNLMYLTKTNEKWEWSSGGGELSGDGSLNQALNLAFSYSNEIFLIVYSHPNSSTLVYRYGIGYIKDGCIGVVQPTSWTNPPLEYDDINQWFREWKPYEMYQENK